jgi:hypothetical protein
VSPKHSHPKSSILLRCHSTLFWPCSWDLPGHVLSLAYESNVAAFNPLKSHLTRRNSNSAALAMSVDVLAAVRRMLDEPHLQDVAFLCSDDRVVCSNRAFLVSLCYVGFQEPPLFGHVAL